MVTSIIISNAYIHKNFKTSIVNRDTDTDHSETEITKGVEEDSNMNNDAHKVISRIQLVKLTLMKLLPTFASLLCGFSYFAVFDFETDLLV